MAKILILLIVCKLTEFSSSEIFSAIEELEKLALFEKLILSELELFAGELKDPFLDK